MSSTDDSSQQPRPIGHLAGSGELAGDPRLVHADFGLQEPEERFDLLKLLLYVVRYRWLIAALAIAGVFVGVTATAVQSRLYRATATLEVFLPSAKVIQDLQIVSQDNDLRAFATAQEKLQSRSIAERVVHALDLSEKPDFLLLPTSFSPIALLRRAFGFPTGRPLETYGQGERIAMAVSKVLANTTVGTVGSTSLLTISYVDPKPLYAQQVANAIAQGYIDQNVDRNSAMSGLARQFVRQQVAQAKAKLQDSERALIQYAKTEGLAMTGESGSLVASNMDAINTALGQAIQERLDEERIVKQVEAGHGDELPGVLSNTTVQDLKEKIAGLEGDYQQNLGQFKPDFPVMRKLQSQISEMKRQLGQLVQSITASFRIKYEQATAREADLRAKLSELQKQQIAFQDKNIQYTILKREVDSNRKQYESLVDKLNELGVGSELKSPDAQIVDRATRPGAPYAPRLSSNLMRALIAALAIAAAAIYFLELLNNSFADPEQIEQDLKLPVLGILPSVEGARIGEELREQKSRLSEAYRSLRTSLQFSGTDGAPRTLLVTSASSAEGKSTTARKLAQDFGALGVSVLIIDADMRRPSLHRMFGADNAIGLSNLLTSTVRRSDRAKLIRTTDLSNVALMTAGTLPPNPADLLMSHKMALILRAFSEKFDMIIIDSPPVVGLSDALILSRLAEGTLMVISAHQVTRKSAKAALKRLRSSGAQVIGAALTKLQVDRFEYKYAYRYLNYDYYTYGSPSDSAEDEGGEAESGSPWLGKARDAFARRVSFKDRVWRRVVRRLPKLRRALT